MGVVHPIHVVGRIRGKLRPLGALEIKFADPDHDMVKVINRIVWYLGASKKYVDLDLAWAEYNMPDDEWDRDLPEELRACNKRLEKLKKKPDQESHKLAIEELQAKADSVFKEIEESFTPRFPAVYTCLFLGAISAGWHSSFLHSCVHRPWNSAPNHGGKWMWEPGATIIDISNFTYAFVCPAEMHFDGCVDEEYRPLELITARQWLKGYGQESEKDVYDWVCTRKERPKITLTKMRVMSEEAMNEVFPSFLKDERDKWAKEKAKPPKEPAWVKKYVKGTEYYTRPLKRKAEETDEEDSDEGEPIPKDKAPEVGGAEEQDNRPKGVSITEPIDAGSSDQEASPASSNDHVVGVIKELLVDCPETRLRIWKGKKRFMSKLTRYVSEHPEMFAAEYPGAVPLLAVSLGVGRRYIHELELSRFRALSGDQVVEMTETTLARNAALKKESAQRQELVLNISFLDSVTPAHLGRIVEMANLKELLIWDNPGLPFEELAKVAPNGQIAKVTTRTAFMEPLKRWVRNCHWQNRSGPVRKIMPPIFDPRAPRIRQVVWMVLMTQDVYGSKARADTNMKSDIPMGALSLEDFDACSLEGALHPQTRRDADWPGDKPSEYCDGKHWVFSELLSFPHHDVWTPLSEMFTSVSRIEKFMSQRTIMIFGHSSVDCRWPLVFPLMMATGDPKSEYTVTSPFPAEAYHHTMYENYSGGGYEQPMRKQGPDPLVHGEYSLVLLREPDLGRLRLGMVTRDAKGQLEVYDPADVARMAGDQEALRAWTEGIGALPAYVERGDKKTGGTEESEGKSQSKEESEAQDIDDCRQGKGRYARNTMLLDVAAIELMWSAATELAAKNPVEKKGH